MTRYFKIFATTPYAGTEVEEYVTATNTDDVEDWGADICNENAEDYLYLIGGWDYEPTEQEIEDYYDGCVWDYEEISADEYYENKR